MDHVVYLDAKANELDKITPFLFNRDDFKNKMDDWLPVEKIEIVKNKQSFLGVIEGNLAER